MNGDDDDNDRIKSRTNNAPVWIKNCAARRFACDGFIKNWRQILANFQGGIECGDGDDCSGCFYA